MAQAPRSTATSAGLSDDPIENAAEWFKANQRTMAYTLGAVAVAVAAVYVYRTTNANARERASAALYQAQAPLADGKLAEAQAALQKVVSRYASTSAGQQAAMLLAQVQFEQKQFDAGIKGLEEALSSASPDFAAAMQGLLATGYESKGDFVKAAEQFAGAAGRARFALEKNQLRASHARSLTSAKKYDEAKAIWADLALEEGTSVAQEAKVRLGELMGLAK